MIFLQKEREVWSEIVSMDTLGLECQLDREK